jgi:uncharacterized protein YodC (DUF2158 family)
LFFRLIVYSAFSTQTGAKMNQFQKGDVVELKSGGPKMVVSDTGDYSTFGAGPKDGVATVWFDGNKKNTDVFDAAVLTKV